MSEEHQSKSEKQNLQVKKTKQVDKNKKKSIGLDIDKIEYQEIVLSHTNFPDRNFFGQDY